jgi:peptidoglycan/LPS O-acetylase OafA/YrhL
MTGPKADPAGKASHSELSLSAAQSGALSARAWHFAPKTQYCDQYHGLERLRKRKLSGQSQKKSMESRQHVARLDSVVQNDNIQHLRAIACLFILCHHFGWLQPFIPQLLWSAWSGVDLFFAISGYVIALSFSRTVVPGGASLGERILINKIAIQAFFIKRFFRIFPPVIVTLALLAFLTLALRITRWSDFLVEATAALSMTYNYVVYGGGPFVLDVLWSLGVEGQFYILIPFFLIACAKSRHGLRATIAVFLLIGVVVRPLYIHEFTELSKNWLAVRFSTHCRLDSLAAGVFVYFALQKIKVMQCASNLSIFTVRCVFVFCVLILLYVPACTSVEFSHNEGFSVLALASATMVFVAAGSGRRIIPFAGVGMVLRYLGERSFGIYLIHRLAGAAFSAEFPKIVFLEHAFGSMGIEMRLVNGLYVVPLTLGLAEIMYRIVEKPSIRAGKFYSAKLYVDRNPEALGTTAPLLDAQA